MTLQLVKSRNGSVYGVAVTLESDDSVTVQSNSGRGYLSAHRRAAARALKSTYGKVRRVATLRHVNLSGVTVVTTRFEG